MLWDDKFRSKREHLRKTFPIRYSTFVPFASSERYFPINSPSRSNTKVSRSERLSSLAPAAAAATDCVSTRMYTGRCPRLYFDHFNQQSIESWRKILPQKVVANSKQAPYDFGLLRLTNRSHAIAGGEKWCSTSSDMIRVWHEAFL